MISINNPLLQTGEGSIDKYAVLGNPIHHSKSPDIHQVFATQTQQSLKYDRILVPLDGLSGSLKRFQMEGGKGVNITLPFKQEATKLVNHLSERAQISETVNTIIFKQDGTRIGDNTDGVGLVRDLVLNKHITLHEKKILIIGAGGAVQGVLESILREQPKEVVILNRTASKADYLTEKFKRLGPIKSFSIGHTAFDVVINGTSASLQDVDLKLPTHFLKKETFCYDMVYGKETTPFLEWARAGGVTHFSDGWGMLVEQAAEAFYLWRGIKPNTSTMFHKL